MLSLREKALLTATVNITTVEGLLQFCRQNESFNDACIVSENFWKVSLARIIGKDIVLQRGDLVGAQAWYNFVQQLVTGTCFKYSLRYDAFNGVWDTQPLSYYAVHYQRERDIPATQDIHRYKFDLPAVAPIIGAQGFLVHMDIGDSPRGEEVVYVFLHHDQNIAFENASRYLGEYYHSHFVSELKREHVFTSDEYLNKIKFAVDGPNWDLEMSNYDEIDLPPPQFFIDLIRDDMANHGGQNGIWFLMDRLNIRGQDPNLNLTLIFELFLNRELVLALRAMTL